MSSVRVLHPTRKITARVKIPGSKSESNRLLILNALSGNKLIIENLSVARDTQNLVKILASDEKEVNVIDAGTSMRFLTAYYCMANRHKVIAGTERMCERPIKPLVQALNNLGFDVRYLNKEGFPPVEIHPVNLQQIKSEVEIEGNISSQYITALLLIAPFLKNGLKVNFTTEVTSRPYVEMTLKMLGQFGVSYHWNDRSVSIPPGELSIPKSFSVGGDWSNASYWYSMAFIADEAEIFLEGLCDDWSQGDRELADWMKRFGIHTEFTSEGALVNKVTGSYPQMMKMNFIDNPDLAQTFAVMFAGKNIYSTFSGLDSLKIKETDRIAALQSELSKANVNFSYVEMYDFYQLRGEFKLPGQAIVTYNDHRMAMSFAPLALLGEIVIENPEVVEKSYPLFWADLQKAGFSIK